MRRKPSITTGIASVALFFAVAGGAAYAANTYMITSTHQIKPSVLSALTRDHHGESGPRGRTGATGPAGANGANGAPGQAGAAGATGATGTQGVPGATGPQGIAGAQGATGPQGLAGTSGTNGAKGTDGSTGPQGAQGNAGVNGLDPATPVLASGDSGWTIDTTGNAGAGIDTTTGKGAAFVNGALHTYGGFDSSTYHGSIGIVHAYSAALSTLSDVGYTYAIDQLVGSNAPTVHVTLIGATADSKFASGFTNLVYVPGFNGVTPAVGNVESLDGFAQGNKWYSTAQPGGNSPTNPGSQDDPQPMAFFQSNAGAATIIQIAVDNGNSSSGTVPYGSEDFAIDSASVGFGGSFTRYDFGG